MNKLAIAIAAIGLIGTPAFAADMGVPTPAPAPVYNWTGWYAGVNAGASFGNVKTDFNVAEVSVLTPILGTFHAPAFSGSDTTYPSGFMGGGQIGYNWQLSPIWVVGLEADFQGAVEKYSATFTHTFDVEPVGATTIASYQTKIEWFGTARLRVGYVWGNGVLTYVTGGLAYGKVDLEGTSAINGHVGGSPFFVSHAIGHSNINTGWTVGYGTEGPIDFWGLRNWTWKIESLYMDLGHLNDTDTPCDLVCTAIGGQTTTHAHFTDGILRGGLNYKFN